MDPTTHLLIFRSARRSRAEDEGWTGSTRSAVARSHTAVDGLEAVHQDLAEQGHVDRVVGVVVAQYDVCDIDRRYAQLLQGFRTATLVGTIPGSTTMTRWPSRTRLTVPATRLAASPEKSTSRGAVRARLFRFSVAAGSMRQIVQLTAGGSGAWQENPSAGDLPRTCSQTHGSRCEPAQTAAPAATRMRLGFGSHGGTARQSSTVHPSASARAAAVRRCPSLLA